MNNVIQFPVAKKAVKASLPKYPVGASPLELRWKIEAQAFTVQCYKDCITSMADPRDQFVARTMHKEAQQKLDIMIAEYTGMYGALAN
jgi:hypothetical protein